jgi:molybdopterin/thiamine biosynthesis adenylyltransferase
MDYDQAYLRNFGLFTREEQEKLRNAKVAVAGLGGVGGVQAATLARMGIGEMAVMDPGSFDPSDMNRQFGARKSTLGRNKALATAEFLRDINPFMKLEVFDQLMDEEAFGGFIENSAVVIEAIDYVAFDYKAAFHRAARAQGRIVLTSPIPDFGALMMVFDPHGMTMEELMGAPPDREGQRAFRAPVDRMFGSRLKPKNISDFYDERCPYISTNAGAAALSGSLVATEAALIVTGKRRREDIVFAPRLVYADLFERVFRVMNPLED